MAATEPKSRVVLSFLDGFPSTGLSYDWDPGANPGSAVLSDRRGTGDAELAAGAARPAWQGALHNLVPYSEDFSQWAAAGGTPLLIGSLRDPLGGLGAYRIAEQDTGSQVRLETTPTFATNGIKYFNARLSKGLTPPAGGSQIVLRDETAPADRMVLTVTWSAGGVPTVVFTTGTQVGEFLVRDDPNQPQLWWDIQGETTSIIAANTHVLRLIPAATAAQIGDIYAFGMQLRENPGGYLKTAGAIVKQADYPALAFDGGDLVELPFVPFSMAAPFELLMVAQIVDTVTGTLFSVTDPGEVSDLPYLILHTSAVRRVYAVVMNLAATLFSAGDNTQIADGALAAVGMSWDGTTLRVTVNGVVEVTTAAPTGDFSGFSAATIGSLRRSSTSAGYNGRIGRILVWDRVLTDSERRQAVRVLRRRYPTLPVL